MGAANSSSDVTEHGGSEQNGHADHLMDSKPCVFQMPLHYPRYKKSDYENMPKWQVDRLLNQYGLPLFGDIHQKRKFAMGAFLWPDQL